MPYVLRVMGNRDARLVAPMEGKYFLTRWDREEVHCSSDPRHGIAFETAEAAEKVVASDPHIRHIFVQVLDLEEAKVLVPYNCDFCNEVCENGTIFYQDEDFRMADVIQVMPPEYPQAFRSIHETSETGWLACPPCAELVRAKKAGALARRSVRKMRVRVVAEGKEFDEALVTLGVTAVQSGFWEHFKGVEKPMIENEVVD